MAAHAGAYVACSHPALLNIYYSSISSVEDKGVLKFSIRGHTYHQYRPLQLGLSDNEAGKLRANQKQKNEHSSTGTTMPPVHRPRPKPAPPPKPYYAVAGQLTTDRV